jgi:5-methylcytosine-specific restriction endonuclease McrA
MTRPTVHPFQTRAGRKLRDQVVREEPTCRLALPGICTTRSTTADHIRPFKTHPELGMVRSNLRGVCEPCNRAKGTLPDELLARDTTSEALSIFKRTRR